MLLKKILNKLHKNELTKKVNFLFRKFTSRFRCLPTFLIIGAQKSGTTSLYAYLSQHSTIAPPIEKEIFYFDQRSNNSLLYYRMFFPLSIKINTEKITFEATPTYLLDVNAPVRIKKILPDAKFVVMLRNPIDRAFSQYNHFRLSGREKRTFEQAVIDDLELISKGINKEDLLSDNNRFRYVLRGCYASFLEYWLKEYAVDKFHFIQSELFFEDTEKQYEQVLDFLNLKHELPKSFRRHNKKPYSNRKVHKSLYEKLEAFYQPYNKNLYEMIGQDYSWF